MSSRFALLGSGNSTGVPWLQCAITDGSAACAVCRDALVPGSRNHRDNPSAALSYAHPDGRPRHILLDCGKTFRSSVLRHFPRLGIAKLDAVILTHGHMDAIGGLDDLRDVSPSATLPVYLSASCYEVVARTFSYLVTRPPAGLFVASLDWRIITPWQPFEVEGLLVMPLPVEHGPPLTMLGYEFACVVAPSSALGGGAVAAAQGELSGACEERGEPSGAREGRGEPSGAHEDLGGACARAAPASSDRLVYISDCSALPADTRAYLRAGPPPSLLVLDALSRVAYPTHFSIGQALACAADLAPAQALLCGMNHLVDYREEGPIVAAAGLARGLRVELGYDGWQAALALARECTPEGLAREADDARAAAAGLPQPLGGTPLCELTGGGLGFTYLDAAAGFARTEGEGRKS